MGDGWPYSLSAASARLPQDGRAVGRIRPIRAGALHGLLELLRLAVVLGGTRIIAAVGKAAELLIVGVPGVCAEWRAVIRGSAVLVHLGDATEVADDRPVLWLA